MPKVATQEFTQEWNRTVNWAKQNNIPYSAYYPVYQMDVQRLMSSDQMSESERIQAIEAAAGLNYSQSLPTDNPPWTDIKANTVRNAEQIVVGLEPTHIIGNVLDTIKNTISHPSGVLGGLEDVGKLFVDPLTGNTKAESNAIHDLSNRTLASNSILTWVPGLVDVAQAWQPGGIENLAKNPISSGIDVVPAGRALSEVVGRLPIAESLAAKADMTIPELRQAGIWRVGGRLIKGAQIPSALIKENHPFLTQFLKSQPDTDIATGETTGIRTPTEVPAQTTVGELWDWAKNKLGASSEVADITAANLNLDQEGTKLVQQMASPFFSKWSKLKPDEREAFNLWSQKDFRSLEDKMADTSIPPRLRDAYEDAYKLTQQLTQLDMQSGRATLVHQPIDDKGNFVSEVYYVDTDQFRAVTAAADNAHAAQAARDEAAKPVEALLATMDTNDRNMYGLFEMLKNQVPAIYSAIKRSIPDLESETAADRLLSTLPEGEKWDRAVAQNTPLIHNLLGLLPSEKLYLWHINAIRDLFMDGGLLDQMQKAYFDQDWTKLNQVSKMVVKKFNGKAFAKIPTDGRAVLDRVRREAVIMQKYAEKRVKLADEINKRMIGYSKGKRLKGGYKKSLLYLSREANNAHQKWISAAIHNPPDVWLNAGMRMRTNELAQADKTAQAMDDTSNALVEQGWAQTQVTKLRQNPRNMMELMGHEAKGSLENPMLPDVDLAESARVTEDSWNYLASLRARGEEPLYVSMQTVRDIERGSPTYNIFVGGPKLMRPKFTYGKVWGYTPTIYDVGSGLLKRTKDVVTHDMTQRFIEQELMPRLLHGLDTERLIRNYYPDEIAALSEDDAEGALTVINRGLEKAGLVEFKPDQIFGTGFSHPSIGGKYYINKHLADGFAKTIKTFQYPAQTWYDRGTQLFRFSILGLSPRYTAHILFGGTYMMLLRGNPGMFKFIGDSWYYARHGSFSEKTLQRFPDEMRAKLGADLQGEHATEEGLASAMYHFTAMNSAGRNWLIPEWMDRHGLPDTYNSRIKAAANLNMTFTRAIRQMQMSMVYLDGAFRASREGKMFYADHEVPRTPIKEGSLTDDQGRPVYHPATGKLMYDMVRSEVPMTAQEALNEGMNAVAEVFGNLRHMTPLERGILTKVFPFYGWTKHVLQYVMSYPFDHPWRAMILSNLAMQDSEAVASGLPLRIQLLTFLGSPDKFGNVTAVDTKSLDPFRDTANYASLTGLFESLNPAITGFGALVDPQFSFAGQNLYPQVTFNSLYGVKTAGAGGNIWNMAEQFVPQLTSLDEAFNLSGQYAYLKTTDPSAFTHKVIESLGLPLMPETINLRQLAAQGQIDRYQQAEAAALNAAQTGDTSGLAGYTTVPDPLNTMYRVTPAYIDAMTQESESKYGLPWYATGQPPPNPPL